MLFTVQFLLSVYNSLLQFVNLFTVEVFSSVYTCLLSVMLFTVQFLLSVYLVLCYLLFNSYCLFT